MRPSHLHKQDEVIYIPLAALFFELICQIDVVQIGTECDHGKVYALFVTLEHAADLRIKGIVVYVQLSVNLVCGHFREGQILVLVLARGFRFESVIRVIQILVVLRIFLVEDIVIHLLDYGSVLARLHKLIVCNRGEEYLPVGFAEAYHKRVYVHPFIDERRGIIQLFFIHKQRKRIALYKIYRGPLIFVNISQASARPLLQIGVYGLVLRIAEHIYLQSVEYILL